MTVDCGAGESVNDALAQTASAFSVNVTIQGVCAEQVSIEPGRDNVVLRGAERTDGASGVSIRDVAGVQLENMTIAGDGVRIDGAESVGLSDVTVSGGDNGIMAIRDAEFGTNNVTITGFTLSRFPSDRHLASWAGQCPGNDRSAGKRRSGKTRHGSKWLDTALTEAAMAATRTNDVRLSEASTSRGPLFGYFQGKV